MTWTWWTDILDDVPSIMQSVQILQGAAASQNQNISVLHRLSLKSNGLVVAWVHSVSVVTITDVIV